MNRRRRWWVSRRARLTICRQTMHGPQRAQSADTEFTEEKPMRVRTMHVYPIEALAGVADGSSGGLALPAILP